MVIDWEGATDQRLLGRLFSRLAPSEGFVKEVIERMVVEKSRLARNALGAPVRSGSERGLASLLA